MDYKTIESYFQDESKLEELLMNYKEAFDTVDQQSILFKESILNNKVEIQNVLDKLTGVYMNLILPSQIAQSQKGTKEDIFYSQRKMEIENTIVTNKKGEPEPKKFVAAAVERESSVHIANYRRVRNIFEAYISACEKGITTCQSKLKSLDEKALIGDNK